MSVNFCFAVGGSSAIMATLTETVTVSAVDGAAVGACVGKGEWRSNAEKPVAGSLHVYSRPA